jgi:myb proto-oncogene protein
VIAAKLRGRTDNDVKNYWNTKLKKRYMMTTAPSTLPTGGDIPPGVDQPPLPATPPPAPVNLDTALATVEDGGDLTHESERLYAELMGLIEQKSTASSCPSTGEAMSSSPPPPPPPPLGTSPTATSSAGSSSTTWPVDVHDTVQLAESSRRSLVEFHGTCGAHAFAAAASWLDSFQDLLASSYDEVIATQLARGAVLL